MPKGKPWTREEEKQLKELLADYINYRQIENRLLEMEQKYVELTSKASTSIN